MRHPLRPISKAIRPWFVLASTLLIALASLTYAYIAERETLQNKASISGSCQFWADLSQIPLTEQSTKTAFTIIADARVAFDRQHCKGELPAPDPRVASLLPPGVK